VEHRRSKVTHRIFGCLQPEIATNQRGDGEKGFQRPEAAEIAAHSTREKKHTLTPGQVLAAHKEVADQYGNQPGRWLQRRVNVRERRNTFRQDARAKEAITYARASLFEREAVADERLILRDAFDAAWEKQPM